MAFDFFSRLLERGRKEKGSGIRMVVGLGNPGKTYTGTRHNVGFMIVDLLARDLEGKWKTARAWKASIATTGGIILVKPLAYMNRSGTAVASIARHHRLAHDELLVIHDDVSLPFGQLRVRSSGSAGGHNGVRDIIRALGTREFPRLRVGIAPQDGVPGELEDFVLGKFTSAERSGLDKVLPRATHAVTHVLEHGVESAMNKFNARVEPPGSTDR